MKYKTRLVVTSVVTATFLLYVLLFAELSAYDGVKECNLSKDTLPPRKFNNSRSADFSETNIDTRQKDRDTSFSTKTLMYNDAVERLLDSIDQISEFGYNRELLQREKFTDMALQLGRDSRVKSKLLLQWGSHEESEEGDNHFVRFHHNIRAGALYNPEDPHIDGLLKDMATEKIQYVAVIKEGTELKLLFTYRKGAKAVFKPMRWAREVETQPDHFYFNDYERHNAEIAAFHLDRVLGFYRVPPVTGRFLSVTKDLLPLADKKFKKTFYVSPAGNNCFYGYCDYYCDSNHPFCGKGDVIEGSIMAWLPDGRDASRDRWFSPFRRSYSKFNKAEWETDEGYCRKLMRKQPYLYKRFIGDFIDSHVFDFITGNMDRHHVEVFHYLRNDSCPIHLDNGRAFGKTTDDEFSIIVPLRQCCKIRKSTFLKLAKLYIGPERLSELLDDSMKSDPVYPILLQGHLNAVDRRVVHILRIVAECVDQAKSIDAVIINDPY
ncbi:extracellular serine/threonine protein kinase FAM20C-like isoform X2 [Mercenaria mercenaria]|nr:extracellular serine/threonine protein kinase FAM20C-like isoform X2 [Mercenaria mercenaria]XP_045181939.2 extracellular serine/threonine protein kinase FAM20C-like isoform X2 [Mercenaria mercenaria]XP_045181940.2 extracellular serine/threonine protein kinase FAM20C-like isoform X2 [Mercenaria mercenaria]